MIYTFGPYSLNTDAIRLTADGIEVAVEPQVFSLVQFLIENRERVVSKDEIIEQVWNGRIVSDGTLNSRINAARRALGDDGKAQAVIKTFPRRGFRFLADLGDRQIGSGSENPEATTAVTYSEKPSIAVLPFDNLSDDPAQDYFSDGIAEDLITALSHFRWLMVIAKNSSFSFKGDSPEPRNIAEILGVRYILEGSVRRVGDRVRISAQLIDCETDSHLWAEHYDRKLEDIFAVQDEITETVIGAIQPELSRAEQSRVKRIPPDNFDAWDFYQRGMALALAPGSHGDSAHNRTAIAMFESAIDRDPSFAAAFASLALSYSFNLWFGISVDRKADEGRGLAAGRRAVELDGQDSQTHTGLASVLMACGETKEALSFLQRATELNENNIWARFLMGNSLIGLGRAKEGIKVLEATLSMGPRDQMAGPQMAWLAMGYLQLRDYEHTVEYARDALQNPTTQIFGNCALVSALAHLDRLEDAKAALAELLRRRPEYTIKIFDTVNIIVDPEAHRHYVDGLRKAGLPEG